MQRTFEVWKKNGGEVVELSPADTKSSLDQVQSIVPGLMNSNPELKQDYDVLSAAAGRLSK